LRRQLEYIELKTGTTPKLLQDCPQLPYELSYVIDIFWTLCSTRQENNLISPHDLTAWLSLYDITLTPFEVTTFIQLDRIFINTLACQDKGQKEK